jgi:hypothetical protein
MKNDPPLKCIYKKKEEEKKQSIFNMPEWKLKKLGEELEKIKEEKEILEKKEKLLNEKIILSEEFTRLEKIVNQYNVRFHYIKGLYNANKNLNDINFLVGCIMK